MENDNVKWKIIVYIGAAVALFVSFLFLVRGNRAPKTAGVLDSFAQCLAQKGAVMYGAYWCPHCQNEKEAFGDSFKFVSYVECTQDTQKCTDQKILGFPTWIFPDGRRFEGEQGLSRLSRESGCSLSQEKDP